MEQVARVVVVEDDPLAQAQICSQIEASPAMTLAGAFSTQAAAIDWIVRNPVDLLLTDLGLPDGSGLAVIAACAVAHPACEILVITLFGDEANILAAIDAGAKGYIVKSAGALDVERFFADLKQGGSPMSPLVARKLLQRVSAQTRAAKVSAQERERLEALTRREMQALSLIARGYAYLEVAQKMNVALSTVQSHLKSAYSKLSVHSRGEAVYEAHRLGLFEPGRNGPSR